MRRRARSSLRSGMKTSPWIILGSTVILLIVVIVLAIQNTNREKRYISKILREKGAALIRAVEAGARTGMMGMMWAGPQIQRLLEETARLPDVLYLAIVDPEGRAVADSDPSKINLPFRPNHKVIHLGPDLEESWELVPFGEKGQAFEVHRRFEPTRPGAGQGLGRMHGMMRRYGEIPDAADDWHGRLEKEQFLIVVGLDVAPFEEAIREDIQTTVVLSVVLLLSGFGGFVSLFWMYSYRTAKQSLQDTSAFADEVVTHMPVGLIATDRDGQITFFNPAAAKITGLQPAMAKGRQPDSVLPPQLCGLKQELDSGATITDKEMECVFSGQRSVPVSVSATRIINEAGQLVGQILILRDLGEVRRLQDEIRRQEKLAALGGLAAGVAHEIRNPLSSIKGLATFFAAQFEDGSESKQAAGVMIQEVDRLNRVITELLDFARPTDLKCNATDLAPLISRSIQLIQQEAANQDIQIETHIADDICPVMIDADRIAQCLLNIYLNAIQAMEHGGKLTVRCETEDNHYARIAVSDTGPGIKTAHLSKIFDPYFTTKNKGTGLGLAIVNKIVEAHQARLKVESEPGKGATFTLRFACQNFPAEKRTL
ncbi:MAG: PAS domain-containing protein [Desulfobacterales bacterium]|nr:PAS domain-containing protein [Desulfobacterales bacterium]